MILKIIKNAIKIGLNFFRSISMFLYTRKTFKKKIKNSEIIFFFPYYHTGGAERVHIAILKALQGKKCTVVFTHGSATMSLYNEFNKYASIIELNPILNKKNIWVNKILQKRIIYLINSSKSVKSVFGCNTSYYYQILPEIKESVIKNDLFHNFLGNDDRENDIVKSASIINKRVLINEAAKQDILNFYKKNEVSITDYEKLLIIENGIELENKFFEPKIQTTIIIGFIGRWSFEKRPLLFLQISKKIKEKYPSVSFIMAGPGMRSNLKLVTDAGVNWLGEITNKEKLNELYKQLHFVLLPSLFEGFPLVIMEAMSHGVIPIATNLNGISQHLISENNGILIYSQDENEIVEEFCDKLSELIENMENRKRISLNSFNYAQENFGMEEFNKSYIKIFN
jgi:glycosyltransferase involved in cell wall biosynthesis